MARLKPNNVSQGKLKSTGYFPEPTGTLTITENGIYDIKNYAYVNIEVSESTIDIQLLTKDNEIFITKNDENFILKEEV